jgi:ribosomal protein L11 methyltransferase
MKWIQFRVTCKAEDLDTVCAIMSMLDNGLMIEDYRDITETGFNASYGELIDDSLLNADKTSVSVSLYIPETKNPNEYDSFIRERLGVRGTEYTSEFISLDEEDWANTWKQYYKPIKISDRLVIIPEWENYTLAADEVGIYIDPGMAFGTGTHETTRLCASLLDRYIPLGGRVLDVGTGSGILAVAASKLGAREVFACDIDPTAVKVARENCELNGVTNVRCEVSDLLRDVDTTGGLYDLITANIVADIIVRLLVDVGKYLNKGGLLITSGIINTQVERVKNKAVECGFSIIDELKENDWIAYVLKLT